MSFLWRFQVKMLTREVTVKTPSNQVCVICLKTIGADPSFITPCVSKTICSDCYKAIIVNSLNHSWNRSGIVGLGILALIFGSIAVGYPVHAAEQGVRK